MPNPTLATIPRSVERATERVLVPLLAMEEKYQQLGGSTFFGEILRKEERVWHYKNGACICYNAKLRAAFEIHGAIYRKWLSLGGVAFGVPCTDELPTPDGVGRFNHFNDNTASIYWTADTGAWAIWGDIRSKWASLGW